MNKILLWGTGESAKRFIKESAKQYSILGIADNSKQGSWEGFPILKSSALHEYDCDALVICSSFVKEVLDQLDCVDFPREKVRVFRPGVSSLISLDSYKSLGDQERYFLPWTLQQDTLTSVLSKDIVYPEVYRELGKSVAYAFVSGIDGDFAEFGTCSGFSSSFISHAVNYYSAHLANHEKLHKQKTRELHLFDSFEGFPASTAEVDINSPHVSSGAWGEGTAVGLNEEQLLNLCGQFLPRDRLKTYAGWYNQTLSSIAPDTRFAFVHMDCDLYQSTYEVLHYLFENRLLSEGSVVLFDNWFCNKASKDFGEQKAWHDVCMEFDVEYTNLGIYACVGNKIIVHNYKKKSD